jgi:predicted MFS family arabinose efflux permease
LRSPVPAPDARPARLFPNPRYYGWTIAGVGLLCSALSSPGQTFALALYLDPLMADTGLSRVELSSLYASVTLLAAACLPLAGAAADRVTARVYLCGVLALLAGGMLILASASGLAGLAAAWFLLRFLGQGAVGIGTLTAATRWFRHYRGRALAVVSLGYAAGEMVFPAVIFVLIATFGWRGSLWALALAYLVLFVPLVARLTRERQASDGPLDGEAASTLTAVAAVAPEPDHSWGVRNALRTRTFWTALLCLSLPSLYLTGVIFHQVALFGTLGWDPSLVPLSMAAFAATAAVGTYATGLTLERVAPRHGVTVSLILAMLGFASVMLPLPQGWGAIVFGALLGLASGAGIATDAVFWPAYFGVRAVGGIRGVVTAVRNGAAAGGAPVAALLYARSGDFSTTLLLFAAVAAAGALVSLSLGGPSARRSAREPADDAASPIRWSGDGKAPSSRAAHASAHRHT